jgi:cell division protein FtsW
MAVKKFADASHYLKRHLICVGLGVGIMSFVRRVPYKSYNGPISWVFYTSVAMLVLVLIPGLGVELNNARRWFQIKSFLLQPAEYAKVVWIVYLSVSLLKKQERIRQSGVSFWPHVILCGLLSGLLLLQPDFGTAFMIGMLTVVMLAVGGVPCRHLFILGPIAMAGLYKFVYKVPYRWERVTAFWNPWTDPLDSGYQLIQAWIAVGSGGLFGKGMGAGHQKLFYLPESYTDFILAVIGEELGFAGILAVCLLFFFLFKTGLRISRNAPDFLGSLMAFGLTTLLTLQALLNMGVVLGLLPTKGLPLPFISYGGSAFTANCLAAGILMNIARSSERRMG